GTFSDEVPVGLLKLSITKFSSARGVGVKPRAYSVIAVSAGGKRTLGSKMRAMVGIVLLPTWAKKNGIKVSDAVARCSAEPTSCGKMGVWPKQPVASDCCHSVL